MPNGINFLVHSRFSAENLAYTFSYYFPIRSVTLSRSAFLFLLIFLSGPAFAESCGPIDATYGIFSGEEIKVESGVAINGNSVDKDDYSGNTGIETDGNTTSDSVSVPGFSPGELPNNSSSIKVDDSDGSIDGSSEVFFEEVTVRTNKSLTFTGSGPFHIETLKVEQNGVIELSSGTYYINEFDAAKNGRLNLSGAVRIYIGDTFKVEQGFGIDSGGNPQDFQVFLYDDTTFELKKNLSFVGVVVGADDTEVKIEQGVSFTGAILTEGAVEIKRNVQLNLSSSQQTAIENVSTCDSVGTPSGGGGDDGGGSGDSSGSCGSVDSTYGIFSGTELEVESGVKINGQNVDKDDYDGEQALEIDGDVSSVSASVPGLDPESFPTNSATNDLDEDDSPFDGSTSVDKIDVGDRETFNFSGEGPFYIDELKVGNDAAVNFSAGDYFIRKIDAKDRVTLNVSQTTRIHVGEEFKLGNDSDLNPSGAPSDLLLFIHEDAKYEANDRTVTKAVIVGVNNEKVRFKNDSNFTGVILSEGKVELEDRVSLTLTPSQQTSIGKLSTCENAATSNINHFVISHDNNGINCLPEVISVVAVDSEGDPVVDYEGEIILTTQSGFGTFSLISGNGALTDSTADDGLAVYQFDVADEGQLSFELDYQQGASSLDIDVYEVADSTTRDDDTEANLVFSPSGFTVTASALSNPPPASLNDPILDQMAGTIFDLHLTAYGQSPTDGTCGVIEDYDGSKNLSFWVDYDDPNSGTLVATIDGDAIAASEAASVAQVVAFSNGQASVAAKYKDVGLIQLEMKDDAIRGATAPFVVYPADIVIVDVSTIAGSTNPGASSMSGLEFVTAGEAFTVVVEVRDAEAARTPNFGNESSVEGIQLTASLIAPVGGRNGSADDGAIGNATAFTSFESAGRFRNTSASWDETGIIQLRASIADGDYLGSGDLLGSFSGNVGRFSVASFRLSSSAVAGACSNTTYMSQPGIAVSYRVEAQGAASNLLSNYDESLLPGVASLTVVAENSDLGSSLASRLSIATSNWLNGLTELNTSSALFARAASVDGPYESLQLGLQLTDGLDGRVLEDLNMNETTSGDCVAAGNCNAVSIGGATSIVYGRLEVQNAFGSETEPLTIGLQVTSRTSSGEFSVQNTDSCTAYALSGATLSNYQGGLSGISVIAPGASTPLINGLSGVGAGLLLSSPGATNTGSVDVEYDAPSWLEFNWSGSGAEDPSATATFGQYRGHDKVIYWREVY